MKVSAGFLIYKYINTDIHFLLVHPGGPHNSRRDLGAWSIPKGIVEAGENLLHAAMREVQEELDIDLTGIPEETYVYLGEVKERSNKTVHAWALELNLPDKFVPKSNLIQFPWPPKTDQFITIPEIDQAEFFDLETAKQKIIPAQQAFIEKLYSLITKST